MGKLDFRFDTDRKKSNMEAKFDEWARKYLSDQDCKEIIEQLKSEDSVYFGNLVLKCAKASGMDPDLTLDVWENGKAIFVSAKEKFFGDLYKGSHIFNGKLSKADLIRNAFVVAMYNGIYLTYAEQLRNRKHDEPEALAKPEEPEMEYDKYKNFKPWPTKDREPTAGEIRRAALERGIPVKIHEKEQLSLNASNKELTEALKILNQVGVLVEAYPGKGYNKPVKQMIEEIAQAGKLRLLRDRLVAAAGKHLERVLPMHLTGIHADTWDANTINLGTGPSNQREAKEKAREVFEEARSRTGIPVYLRKYRPVAKNGYGEWLAYFNLFSNDYGTTKIEDIASLLTNNDEYWEILDDVYTKRTNKTVNDEPSEEEKNVIQARETSALGALNRISSAPLSKKDWERFNSSTIGRQLGTLNNLSEEKLNSRKHAILLMMAKKYYGIIGEKVDFGDEEVDIYKLSRFLRGCGIPIPRTPSYIELRSSIQERLKEIKDYFKDELEVLEQ